LLVFKTDVQLLFFLHCVVLFDCLLFCGNGFGIRFGFQKNASNWNLVFSTRF
jgi:hypothetical protein